MKTLGIVGGIGPESTLEYYRSIIAAYRKRKPDGSYPSVIINSIDMTAMIGLVSSNALTELTRYLLDEVRKLAAAGAHFGLLAANTPHIVFGELQRRSPIPLLSIVEAACDAATHLGLRKLGLFGAKYTMEGHFYAKVFSRAGMTLAIPLDDERSYIHDKYMSELVLGVFKNETRERMLAIMERMKVEEGIEGLILGGTELPLLLRDQSHQGIPLLDTTQIHVQRAVAMMLS